MRLITSDVPNAKAEILGGTYDLPAVIKVRRSREDLNIKLIADNSERNDVVKASPNGTFLYVNWICWPILPIMYGVDFTNQKRFYYVWRNSPDTLLLKIIKR